MRHLLGFVRGLGLDEAAVREIYETVGREGMATGAGDDVRLSEPPLRSPRRREHPLPNRGLALFIAGADGSHLTMPPKQPG
ncbi:hypothetical protein [Methylorubrum extorquens]|uniref:Uncharacterized protein n=1 Tax=Methylorubrum extorquens TaxID=408 RepID=A0AAX3WEE9_METEX|nr:hypothetical protein [Methylorubrum extorquens]WHQ68763.1 hypothetical protein KEC54_20725 [Methylorubrum extorquens]